MSIDERLEAITRNLELLASIQRDNERRESQRFLALTEKIEQLSDAVTRLVQVADNHEDRIHALETN